MSSSSLTRGGQPRTAPATTAPTRSPHRLTGYLLDHPSVLLAVLTTVVLHLMFWSTHLGSDEGGFAMIARYWQTPGRYLYGPMWVDRPPGLIAVFALADHLGTYGVRLTATVAAVVIVLGTATAAGVVGGRSAARWAAWVAAALASSVLLAAQQLNGELIAAGFVAIAMAASSAALRRPSRASGALALTAGVAAAAAPLVKQDFGDALVFVLVLLVVPRRGVLAGSRAHVARWFLSGVAIPVLTTLTWARQHHGVSALWFAAVGFRARADSVMARWSSAAPDQRAHQLAIVAVITGVAALGVLLAGAALRRRRHWDAVGLALLAAFAVELVGVLGGGNYWSHYLLGLVPTLAVASGLACRRGVPGRLLLRGVVVAAVAVSAVAAPWYAVQLRGHEGPAAATAGWLRDAAHPGDTLVVPSSSANVIEESGLRPVYPYAWSLPVRTLDPHLLGLRSLLASRSAPSWVVLWEPTSTWGLDPAGRVQLVLHARYHLVAHVCGRPVWLHDGLARDVPPAPTSGCHGVEP